MGAVQMGILSNFGAFFYDECWIKPPTSQPLGNLANATLIPFFFFFFFSFFSPIPVGRMRGVGVIGAIFSRGRSISLRSPPSLITSASGRPIHQLPRAFSHSLHCF